MSGAQALFHGCLVKKGPTDQGIQFFSQVDTSGTLISSAAAGAYHSIAITGISLSLTLVVCPAYHVALLIRVNTDSFRAIGWGMNKAPPGVSVRPQTQGTTNLYGLLGAENQSACVPFFLSNIDGTITAAACNSSCSAVISSMYQSMP
jgi:hypothetical protein